MDLVTCVKNDVAERRYKVVNQPLGKPAFVDVELRSKKFGKQTISSESVGSVMNLTHLTNSDDARLRYVKSHNHYGVGEKVCFNE